MGNYHPEFQSPSVIGSISATSERERRNTMNTQFQSPSVIGSISARHGSVGAAGLNLGFNPLV